MNRKGFTLLELLAVIIILGIVLIFTTPNILGIFENSEIKSEEIFVGQLSKNIDSFISLNSNAIVYEDYGTYRKSAGETVEVYKSTITFDDIIDSKIMSLSDYVNPGNKKKECNVNAVVEIYKDSDLVYCYKLPKLNDNIGCLSNKYLNGIEDNYILNTCVWEEE